MVYFPFIEPSLEHLYIIILSKISAIIWIGNPIGFQLKVPEFLT